MDVVLLTSRCAIALVFLVAAVGKLFDLAGSRQAIEEFGVPAAVARLAGPLLPGAELLVATALLLRPTAVVGAAGAMCLLLAFMGGIARAMSRGAAPDCHCFGQIHSEPAGPSTLIRNAVLAALAVVILAGGSGPSLTGGLSSLNGTQGALVVTSVLAVFLALATAQLWSDRRRLQAELADAQQAQAVPGLPRGTRPPEFELRAVRGTVGSLEEFLRSGGPAVLVFVSTTCGPCQQMLPTLARWQESISHSLTLVAIFSGELDAIDRLSSEHGLSVVLAQEYDEIFELYSLRATPSGVLIGPDGLIAGAPAEGVQAIEALIRAALARSSEPRELEVIPAT